MANQKLTQEEIDLLNSIGEKKKALQAEFGQIKLLELDLEERSEKAEEFRANLIKENQQAIKQLQDKYGLGSIDLQAGEFIPAKQ